MKPFVAIGGVLDSLPPQATAAAARAIFSALATESRNRRARCLLPSAKPDRTNIFAAIHRPHIRDRRNDAMRNTLPPAP